MSVYRTQSVTLPFKGDDSATQLKINILELLSTSAFPFLLRPDEITVSFSTNDGNTISGSPSFDHLVATVNFTSALSSTANMGLTFTFKFNL